jgi:putative component of membrane protein insertase Oxa1/YidC/SpoIIIJ protein YidD
MQALDQHGALKGLWLGLRRILKCHPYYKGDFIDEVPSVQAGTDASESGKSCKVDCK